MTPDKQIKAKEKDRLHTKTSRLGMSTDEKTNMKMKAVHRIKRLRLNISPENLDYHEGESNSRDEEIEA
jgi:hypothetical protein